MTSDFEDLEWLFPNSRGWFCEFVAPMLLFILGATWDKQDSNAQKARMHVITQSRCMFPLDTTLGTSAEARVTTTT